MYVQINVVLNDYLMFGCVCVCVKYKMVRYKLYITVQYRWVHMISRTESSVSPLKHETEAFMNIRLLSESR
jgi:hypothetical protein